MKFLGLVLLLLSVGCSSTFISSTEKRVPPKIDVRKYQTIAVETIIGDNNQAFSNALIQELLKEKRMKVVQRNDMIPLIREETLNQKGKIKRADLVISGSVDEYFDSKLLSEGGKVEGYRLHEYAETKAGLTITDSATGEILYSGNISGVQDGTSPWIRPEEAMGYSKRTSLTRQAREKAVKELVGVMYPSKEEVWVHLFADRSTPELKEGRDLFFKRRYDEAVKKFEDATKSSTITPEGLASAYNEMALIKGFNLEKYDEALQLIDKAASIQNIKELEDNKAQLLQAKADFTQIKKLGL